MVISRMLRLFNHAGWPVLLLVCFLPVLRWATMQPLGDRFSGPVVSLLSIGQISGLLGLTMYAFNLLLSTRIKFFEDLFGGINKVFIAHHVIGGWALVMLLVHPLMLALRLVPSSVTSAAMLFVPQLDDIPMALGIVALAGTIGLLYLTFFVTLPYSIWLFTHKFLGGFFFLGGVHALLVPNDLSQDPWLEGYMVGFVALGLISFVYRTLLPRVFVRRYWYVVRQAAAKAPGVVEVQLVPEYRLMNFRPGQFVFLSFQAPGISREWHPFTISSAPGSGDFSVTVKALGTYTKTLTDILPALVGTRVGVEGAYGRFTRASFGNPNQVWIAGGIGVTPFLSMAQDLGAGPYNIDLYYAVKTQSELIDFAMLQQQQSITPARTFRVIPFISDQQPGVMLTASIINKITPGLAQRDILICGPPPMMKALRQQLRAMGVPNNRIHTEEFSMS